MKSIVITLFFVFGFYIALFADTPAIKNIRTDVIYTDFDLACSEAIVNDTFVIGEFDTQFVEVPSVNYGLILLDTYSRYIGYEGLNTKIIYVNPNKTLKLFEHIFYKSLPDNIIEYDYALLYFKKEGE